MNRRHAVWFVVLAIGSLAITLAIKLRPGPRASGVMPQSAYVWQRSWDDSVRQAVLESQGHFSELVALSAEVEWRAGSPRIVRVPLDYETLRQSKTPVGIALRIGAFSGPFQARDEVSLGLCNLAQSLIHEAASNHLDIAELQIDFDCAESKLAGYGVWVDAIHEQIAPIPVVITALPAWLKRSAFRSLIAKADGYVLQVHSLARPQGIDSPFSLCDPKLASVAVERAASLGKPFRVALPTYGYVLAFDPHGRFAGLSAEGPDRLWPTNYSIREVHADPVILSELIHSWTSNRPAALQGVIWYRLPVPNDRLNWHWPTLAAVMEGTPPRSGIRVEKREPQAGLVEIDLVNDGQADFTAPLKVVLRWTAGRLVASDAFRGFEVEETATNTIAFVSTVEFARLGPGERRALGWARLNQPSELSLESHLNDR